MSTRFCALLLFALSSQQGWTSKSLGPWIPLFQGIDIARGTNVADAQIPVPQLVCVARVDLNDPDIRLVIPTIDQGARVLEIDNLNDVELYFYHYSAQRLN